MSPIDSGTALISTVTFFLGIVLGFFSAAAQFRGRRG